MADEFEFHLQTRVDHWREQGLSHAEAVRRARVEFGGIERYKEECREHVGVRLLRELAMDLRYAMRRLAAAPMFATVAIAILAIAIGAGVAVFSVFETVAIKTLPVERPEDVRELAWVAPADSPWSMSYDGSKRPYAGGGLIATSFSYPVYTHLRDHTTAFSDLFLFAGADVTATANGRDQRALGLLVSGNVFRGLGVAPSRGRALTPDDDRAGAPAVVVLGHGFWQRAFGGDPSAIGQSLIVNGVSASVVGIAPPAFYGVEPGVMIDVYAPVSTFVASTDNKGDRRNDPRFWAFRVMGRLNADVSETFTATETNALVRQALPPAYAEAPSGLSQVVVAPGGQGIDSLRRNYRQPLVLLLVIVGLVLLVACCNVASLLIIRNAARAREIRVRLALGAGRFRVVRQLLTESLLLAAISTVFGVGLSMLLRHGVMPLLNQENEPLSLSLAFDFRSALFVIVLFFAVTMLCGLLPAWRVAREIGSTSGRVVGVPSRESTRLFAGKTLIVIQVAVSMVLLASAGLFVRTVDNLRSQPLGFRTDHLLLFQLDATASGYQGRRLTDFYDQVLQRLTALPGVESAALSRYGLLEGGATRDAVTVAGAPEQSIGVHVHYVSPHYFDTMGIPLTAGRTMAVGDGEGAPRVVVVNEALARALPGGGMAIGRRITYDSPDADVEIVGVVGDARFASLREPARPTIYLPYRQYRQHRMVFAMRTASAPLLLGESARRAVDEVDPRVPVYEMRTQEAQVAAAMRQERMFAYVASGVALLALFMACLGVYGTLAYGVARRTREIGLRLALGASRAGIVLMVIRESLVPVFVGAVAGVISAIAATEYLRSMLFGLTPRDPATLAVACAALIGCAIVAAWLPSRRASRVEPLVALRAE